MEDLPTERSRLDMIDSLCKMRIEYKLYLGDLFDLIGLIDAVAKDPGSAIVSASDTVASVRRSSSLSKALKSSFPEDHFLWGYIKWIY